MNTNKFLLIVGIGITSILSLQSAQMTSIRPATINRIDMPILKTVTEWMHVHADKIIDQTWPYQFPFEPQVGSKVNLTTVLFKPNSYKKVVTVFEYYAERFSHCASFEHLTNLAASMKKNNISVKELVHYMCEEKIARSLRLVGMSNALTNQDILEIEKKLTLAKPWQKRSEPLTVLSAENLSDSQKGAIKLIFGDLFDQFIFNRAPVSDYSFYSNVSKEGYETNMYLTIGSLDEFADKFNKNNYFMRMILHEHMHAKHGDNQGFEFLSQKGVIKSNDSNAAINIYNRAKETRADLLPLVNPLLRPKHLESILKAFKEKERTLWGSLKKSTHPTSIKRYTNAMKVKILRYIMENVNQAWVKKIYVEDISRLRQMELLVSRIKKNHQ